MQNKNAYCDRCGSNKIMVKEYMVNVYEVYCGNCCCSRGYGGDLKTILKSLLVREESNNKVIQVTPTKKLGEREEVKNSIKWFLREVSFVLE